METRKIEIKNINEYLELLHQLKDIIEKLNNIELEIEIKK